MHSGCKYFVIRYPTWYCHGSGYSDPESLAESLPVKSPARNLSSQVQSFHCQCRWRDWGWQCETPARPLALALVGPGTGSSNFVLEDSLPLALPVALAT